MEFVIYFGIALGLAIVCSVALGMLYHPEDERDFHLALCLTTLSLFLWPATAPFALVLGTGLAVRKLHERLKAKRRALASEPEPEPIRNAGYRHVEPPPRLPRRRLSPHAPGLEAQVAVLDVPARTSVPLLTQ